MPESSDTPNESNRQITNATGFDIQMINKSRSSGEPSMSSRVIAELLEARHDNVRRTIERLVERGVIVQPPTEDEPETDAMGRVRTTKVYMVGKRDSYIVVAQLSPEFTARLVDRWQELEAVTPAFNPASLSRLDLLHLAIDAEQELQHEREQRVVLQSRVEAVAPKVAFAEQVALAPDAISVAQAAKCLGTGQRRLMAFLRQAGWVSRRNEPYQAKVEAGLLDVKISPFNHPKQGLSESITPLVTGKGLSKLHEIYSTVPA